MPADRHHEVPSARLPPHLGDLALRRQPRPRRAAAPRGMEDGHDGDEIYPRQREGTSAYNRSATLWGNSRGTGKWEGRKCLNHKAFLSLANARVKGVLYR